MIGMIHLEPLPGYRKHPGTENVIGQALRDLDALEHAHFDAALVENEHDHPHRVKASPEIIAAMTRVVSAIVKKAHIPIGMEILLNDPKASIAVAFVCGAAFIRTDYFVDRMSRKEYGGEMDIDPKGLMAYRHKMKADTICIFTDLQVKYATLLEKGKTIAESATQAIKEGSDGLIITGDTSGQAPKLQDLIEATKSAAEDIPVFVGSGFCPENARALLTHADGAIVGTAIQARGHVAVTKAKRLIQIVSKAR